MQFRDERLPWHSLLLCSLAAADPTPRSWIPEPKTLSDAVTDGNPETYELLCTGTQADPCDIGLEWVSPQRSAS